MPINKKTECGFFGKGNRTYRVIDDKAGGTPSPWRLRRSNCVSYLLWVIIAGCVDVAVLVPTIDTVNPTKVTAAQGCNYYASPNGTGDGLSQSTSFKINNFWSNASPGETLCLMDGTYTGSDSMINPPDNLSGTSGYPITVRALNDGRVTIDGQGSLVPVYLRYNDYFVIEGINAHDSSGAVFAFSRANHNIVRRVIGWDAAEGNNGIFGMAYSNYNLLEDTAGWGIGRKVFSSSSWSNHTTMRRAFGSWDGYHSMGPKMGFSTLYKSTHITLENSIGTWTGKRMKETYTLFCNIDNSSRCGQLMTDYAVDQPFGGIAMDRIADYPVPYDNKDAYAKVFGNIAYVMNGAKGVSKWPGFMFNKVDSVEFRDNAVYLDSSYASKPGISLTGFPSKTYSFVTENAVASGLTMIGGSGLHTFSNHQWDVSNIEYGPNRSSVSSIFASSKGAKICTRYKDGELTDEPLWPWPMDQRIYDALIQSGDTPFYVTQKIEEMFGTIPSECKTGSQDHVPPVTPKNVRVLSN